MFSYCPTVLRPRELVVELVARALDDDVDAEADLHALAKFDQRADAALEALALTAVEALADAGAYQLPPADDALLVRVRAVISVVGAERACTAPAARRPHAAGDGVGRYGGRGRSGAAASYGDQ